MAGGKQTPRQRMMGILYLVLLGLIALDVPDSLLDAFKNISDSLQASKTNVSTGIDQSLKIFAATKLVQQKERALPIYDDALNAQKAADSLTNYVDEIKKKMMDETGGFDDAINDYKGRADLDVSVRLMINDQKYAYELYKKINDTKTRLLSLVAKLNPSDTVGMELPLSTTTPPDKAGFPHRDWENANFGEGMPMAAAMTELTKIQSDTKNAEDAVIKKILGKIEEAQVNLDQFQAVAVAPSQYIIAGQPFTAQVFLTASDSKSNPHITVNGSPVQVQGGRGLFTIITSGSGMQHYEGKITVKQNNGRDTTYSTGLLSYEVAKPSAVVSPDKMNVLYIGVPNPLSVSAPGVSASDIKATMSGGSITGSGTHYTATVHQIGMAKVTVYGEKGLLLGTSEFRVKRIPDPKAEFAGKSGGSTGAANIRAQDRLFAILENFEFDAKFSVTRFTLFVIKPRQDALIYSTTGNVLNSSMRQAMSTVTPGTTVVFKDIIAVGPDGSQRGLDPIVLTAN